MHDHGPRTPPPSAGDPRSGGPDRPDRLVRAAGRGDGQRRGRRLPQARRRRHVSGRSGRSTSCACGSTSTPRTCGRTRSVARRSARPRPATTSIASIFAVPAEARSLQATSAGGALTTSVRARRPLPRGDGPLPEPVLSGSPGPSASSSTCRAASRARRATSGSGRRSRRSRHGRGATTGGRPSGSILPTGFDDAGYGEDIVERTRPDHGRDVDRHDPPAGRVVSRRRRGSADAP